MIVMMFAAVILISLFMNSESEQIINDRPIIGILSQELNPMMKEKYPNKTCYIAASYVKYVEGAGARAVPIWIGKDRSYYEKILSKINGVLLPGGAVYFSNENGFADAGEKIFDIIIDMNQRGIHFPLWGTCLGFELLFYLATKRNFDKMAECNGENQISPIKFVDDINVRRISKLYKHIPKKIYHNLQTKNITTNFHKYCITQEQFNEYKLYRDWYILSVSYDLDNFEHISSIEHKKYPIYGVQFHPEKNIYEFTRNRTNNNGPDAVEASQYYANFFIREARKNLNSFDSTIEEANTLFYKYCPEYTGPRGSPFAQVYYFDENDMEDKTVA